MERLTAQEESVMLYIWKLGSCFIRDILNEMPDPKPPYTSVASVVRNLEKKKYVTPKKFGTITLFSPRVKEAEYKRTFMSNVVQNYFTGSYKEMVSFYNPQNHPSTFSKRSVSILRFFSKTKRLF